MITVDSHIYEDCKIESFSYNGYDAVNEFCNWLFSGKITNATVMAHNQAGYDGRFIFQWCLRHNMRPTKFIRQGSRLMYMEFSKFRIEFTDFC